MDLKLELDKLAELVTQRKQHINNEEATKQSLIIPFIHKLGYDVFNPLEVQPEYISDFGFKKGEKVDYAIKKDGELVLFVEAKGVYEEVTKHSAQLYRYFNATPSVRFSILTNGIVYKLFTDLNQDNIMDDEPFYTFNIEELTLNDVEVISNITKEIFNKESMIKYSQELVYLANVNTTLKDLFKNPTDDFVRFLIKDINNQRVTTAVLDKFRPIIKKAINKTLLEMIGEGLSFSEKNEVSEPIDEKPKEYIEKNEEVNTNGVITTEEELKAFDIVREVLQKNKKDVTNLTYKDNSSYFNIMNRVITKWFIRAHFDVKRKYLILRLDLNKAKELTDKFEMEEAPKGHYNNATRVYIETVEDLKNMEELILLSYAGVRE